jgi:hypothetical protein
MTRIKITISRTSYLFILLLTTFLWAGNAFAASVTMAVLKVNAAETEVEFIDIGVGACANKAQGVNGCLKMETGNSGPLNFMLQESPGWRIAWIQIREPFANWLDNVPQSIRDDLKEIGGGGGNFFPLNGEHVFGGNTRFFNINDLNTSEFVIQYRIAVEKGGVTLIAHPILDNEG